jgi:hypothetical protein
MVKASIAGSVVTKGFPSLFDAAMNINLAW